MKSEMARGLDGHLAHFLNGLVFHKSQQVSCHCARLPALPWCTTPPRARAPRVIRDCFCWPPLRHSVGLQVPTQVFLKHSTQTFENCKRASGAISSQGGVHCTHGNMANGAVRVVESAGSTSSSGPPLKHSSSPASIIASISSDSSRSSTSVQGLNTRSHSRSTWTYLAPFRSTGAYSVPHITQIYPWMCPEGAQVEL